MVGVRVRMVAKLKMGIICIEIKIMVEGAMEIEPL
jgi:hypothetical protein